MRQTWNQFFVHLGKSFISFPSQKNSSWEWKAVKKAQRDQISSLPCAVSGARREDLGFRDLVFHDKACQPG